MKWIVVACVFVLTFGLAACRGAQEPQVAHRYGNTSYTTGVYEDPSWVPGAGSGVTAGWLQAL